MVNPNALPSPNEIMATYNAYDQMNQVEMIPTDFMVKAVIVWLQKWITTEIKAQDYIEEIIESYDPFGQVASLVGTMNYRQILVEIARQKLICNEDIFATIVA